MRYVHLSIMYVCYPRIHEWNPHSHQNGLSECVLAQLLEVHRSVYFEIALLPIRRVCVCLCMCMCLCVCVSLCRHSWSREWISEAIERALRQNRSKHTGTQSSNNPTQPSARCTLNRFLLHPHPRHCSPPPIHTYTYIHIRKNTHYHVRKQIARRA